MSEKKYRQIRTARAENIPATIARIFSYISRHYTVHFIFAIACMLVASGTNVFSSRLFATIIDGYIVPMCQQINPDFTPYISLLVKIALLYLTAVICSYAWRKLMSVITTGVLHDIRYALFEKMQDMSVSFYDTHTHGELMNFYTSDVDILRPLMADSLPAFISTIITLIGVFAIMITLNITLTLISAISIALMGLITYALGKGSRKYFKGIQKCVSDITGYVEEMFQGQKVIKVFQHEKENIEQFKVYAERMFEASYKSNAYAGALMPINGNLSYITYALIAVIGGKMAVEGQITFGQLVSFLLLSRQVAGPVSNISQQFNGIMMAIAGAERVFRLIDSPSETDEGKIELVNVMANEDGTISKCDEKTGNLGWYNPEDNSVTLLRGDIRLNNVTFGYAEGKTIIHDISLYAKPGQKIAFVGSTGAGKTTITSLINRFYDVNEGSITYDGFDIRDIRKSSLRASIGVVLQDTNLFSGTVMDNIRYGRPDASNEECIEAAKLANADSFISRLPQGYNTMLSANGSNLSQGQRQLLNIARAAVSDPAVLILDEATSSIDTHTERLIEKGMDKLMAGRTVFVIAHRLSTVRNSNAIIVLEHGQIIERGDHNELLMNKGRYYQLYTGKAELD